jgi:hypothetical protein
LTAFTLWETHLAIRLGVPRSEVASARKLFQQGLDWEVVNKRICWSEAAAVRMAKGMGVALEGPAQDKPEAPEGSLTPAEIEKPQGGAILFEEMVVHRWRFPNKRIIQCRRQDGTMAFVRVRNSKNFRPKLVTGQPMVVRAFRDVNAWALVGTCPRWPGKW